MATLEKRQFERKSCYVEAHYESPTLSLNVVIKNISPGGCFINTPYLDTIGTSGMIFIKLPHDRSPIGLLAKVVYTKDDSLTGSGMGLKFQFYRAEDILKINQIINQIEKGE